MASSATRTMNVSQPNIARVGWLPRFGPGASGCLRAGLEERFSRRPPRNR